MCNSQLWHRSESTCIPRKVFSVQKSDETSYPIMCSQSQDMLLLSHRGLPQSQYIYGNHPPPTPPKTPWLRKLYHCWVKTTGSLLFGTDTWSDPQSLSWGWRTEVWSHEVICAGIAPKSAAPVWCPHLGLSSWCAEMLPFSSLEPADVPDGSPLAGSASTVYSVYSTNYYFLDVPSY